MRDRAIGFGLYISLTLLIFSSVVLLITISSLSYRFFLPYVPISNSYHLTIDQMQENYTYLISYILGKSDAHFALPHLPFSKEGARHFHDVRSIYRTIEWMFVLSVLTYSMCRYFSNVSIFKTLRPVMVTYGIFIVCIGAYISKDFTTAFIQFHELLFTNDYWVFYPEKDPIILYLPETLFMYMAFAILLVFLFIVGLSFFYYRFRKQKTVNKVSSNIHIPEGDEE